MQRLKKKKLIPLALGIFASLTLTTPSVNASAFGAEIFCTMRDGGNDHESSWDAAYTYIKKQKGGLFKVSPCLLYTSPSPRDKRQARMPSSA